MRAAALPNVPDWERESTARQLATLWRLAREAAERDGQPYDDSSETVLRRFLGDSEAALTSVVQGRIGLALSGGGFRASLYHLGVLAKLAELDLLRHVEYLSCVSGGAIVGAAYYLAVRELLQKTSDAEITRDDYVALVAKVAMSSCAASSNIRTARRRVDRTEDAFCRLFGARIERESSTRRSCMPYRTDLD